MSDLLQTIRAIVQDELRRLRVADLAIVEEQHPHAADDDEDSLFCKAVMVGAPLYVEAIFQVFAEGASRQPQRLEEGRSYRFVERTVAAERRVRRLLKNGLLRRYTKNAR